MFFTVIISDSMKSITSLKLSKDKFSAGMTEGQSVIHAPTAVQFSHSVMSDSATPWTAAHQASLSITNSWSPLKLLSIESVMPSAISSSVVPFSSGPQSFPALGSFQMSQLFASGGQRIGVSASASVLPMNIQD